MNKEIRTLLVDDEYGCLTTLKHYLDTNCPRINVIGTARTTGEAMQLINTLPVDLAFLDVHLFDTNIFEVLPSLYNRPVEKIFVTAYEQYAMQAFRISALDYLLKPLETAEVVRCYGKIERYFNGNGNVSAAADATATSVLKKNCKITLRQGDNVYVIPPEQLLVLKAHGIYTTIYFEHNQQLKTVLMSKPINSVCKQWDIPDLIRVHRSYAINIRKVTGIKKQGCNLSLEIAGTHLIPVAKRRAAAFFEHYNQ